MGRCFKLYRCMDLYWHFFFAASLYYRRSVRATSYKLIAKKVKWKMNGNFGWKWFFFYFHFIPRFDIHPNTYSAISIVNVHQICNIYQKYTFFSFLAKCILVLLAHDEKSSKLLNDSNRFPSFKPLFSKFLSRFLIKLAASNNSNF